MRLQRPHFGSRKIPMGGLLGLGSCLAGAQVALYSHDLHECKATPLCSTIRHVADPTPEVTNELVRLMNGGIDYDDLPEETLYKLGEAATRHQAAAALHRKGVAYSQMADRWGVHESTAWRWAQEAADTHKESNG
jgi:hypothetical protein